MSLRIPSIFVLTWLVAVFLCGIQLAAGESPVAFEYKGLPGQMTIEQAKDYGGHSLACETDTIAPASQTRMSGTVQFSVSGEAEGRIQACHCASHQFSC